MLLFAFVLPIKLYFIHSRKWWGGNCNYLGGKVENFIHIEHCVLQPSKQLIINALSKSQLIIYPYVILEDCKESYHFNIFFNEND